MPTAIQWCDETFNPWWGCAEVSAGCAHCYARTWAKFTRGKLQLWPERGQPSLEHGIAITSPAYWKEPLKWARDLPAKLGRRPRIFCASMADVFEELDELHETRCRLFELIGETSELDWLILTKRPDFARDWLASLGVDLPVELPNVWLGVSIENARFTWRADVLREIPAAVRFISAEPLIGSLFAGSPNRTAEYSQGDRHTRVPLDLAEISWVIIGGESGPGARPFHLEHAREIIAACDPYVPVCCGMSGTDECCNEPVPRGQVEPLAAVFVKQLGARPHVAGIEGSLRDRKGGDPEEWPDDLRLREFPHVAVAA